MLAMEFIIEYDSAAEWVAKRGLAGVEGDPLPTNLSEHTFNEIKDYPDEFQERVKEMAYWISAEHKT